MKKLPFGNLGSAFPPELREALYYGADRILYVALELEFEPRKNKFLVLLDDKEPPLFFLINSELRGLNQKHEIEMSSSDYKFLTKGVSYLNYDQTFETFDKVNHPMPTKQELLDILSKEPERYKGKLRREDAKSLLYGVENEYTAIDERDRIRIVAGLKDFLKSFD